MRHRFGNAKLKRDVGSRNSLFKNLTTSVIEHERVITTVPKAKAVQPIVENMITLAKRDTLHTRRQAAAFLTTPKSVQKLFDTLGTRFGQRTGGYTRITAQGPAGRPGAGSRGKPGVGAFPLRPDRNLVRSQDGCVRYSA
jgi:large subunit ribosomal protein L17